MLALRALYELGQGETLKKSKYKHYTLSIQRFIKEVGNIFLYIGDMAQYAANQVRNTGPNTLLFTISTLGSFT